MKSFYLAAVLSLATQPLWADDLLTSPNNLIMPFTDVNKICRDPASQGCNTYVGVGAGNNAQGSHNLIMGDNACPELRGDFNICLGSGASAGAASHSLILPGRSPLPLDKSDTDVAALVAGVTKYLHEIAR